MVNVSNELILAINLGSTSTKIAVYQGEKRLHSKNFSYTAEQIGSFKNIFEQKPLRQSGIEEFLKSVNVDISKFDAVVSRGGALPPHKTGAYMINDLMLDYLENKASVLHAACLGPSIAKYFADKSSCDAYIYDGPHSNEMRPVARVTGLQGVYRKTVVHVLNGRACIIKYAKSIGKQMSDINVVVAHLGGGISISAYEKGILVDCINDKEGPISPERAGRLANEDVILYYDSSGCTKQEMLKLLRGRGGFVSLLETNSALEVEKQIAEGNEKAKIVYDTMCYQTAKCIGEMSVALKGNVDAIIMTGNIAHSNMVVNAISEYVKHIAPIEIMPGEFEMEALSLGVLRVIRGEEICNEFTQATIDNQFKI